MREVGIMRNYAILMVILALVLAVTALEAKELALTPSRVETIVSPEEVRDARVLVYFELPAELMAGKARVMTAALLFRAGIEDADYGLVHVFPVTGSWRTAESVGWSAPWEKAGGDYAQGIAGKSVTLKASKGVQEISSNVTFIVMDWVAGRLANNGLILVPSEQDLVDSAARFGFDKGSLRLRIEWSE
jgi:hypothetical protein